MDTKEIDFNELRSSEYKLGKYISEEKNLGKNQTDIVDELNKEFVQVGRKGISPEYASRLKNIYDLYVCKFGIDRELLESVSFRNLDELKRFSSNRKVAMDFVTRLRAGEELASILEGINDIRAQKRAQQIRAKRKKG